MMSRGYSILLGITIIFCSGISRTWAHGANIQYKMTQSLQITALYDDGRPMKEAQVIIYSPDDPTTPWLKGTTDQQGNFTFVPDFSQKGNWDVKVRQAGHGDIISIPLTSNHDTAWELARSPSNSAYTPLQKGLMAFMGIWGFVGTALFFKRDKAHL